MTQHAPETKAAVMAALLQGQSITEVARGYRIPKQTVCRWRDEAYSGTVPGQRGTPEQDEHRARQEQRIGELWLELLEVSLEAARAQLEHTKDRAWLQQQTAEGLAVLHGITVDKAVRLAEALSPERDEPPDDGAAEPA